MPELLIRPVLVPGLGLDERSSSSVREHLPADVVLLPGTGLAEPVPPLEQLAAALRARLGEGPVLLVGHSQSCQVVAAAAGDPRVAGLVLLGLPQWLRTGPRAMSRLWAALSPDRIDARLRTVRVPVTVARGTRDRLCPHDWAAAVAAAAPQGRLVEIPGASHLTPMTHAGQVAALVRAAAGSAEPGRRRTAT